MAQFAIPLAEIDDAHRNFEFAIERSWLAGVLEGTDIRPADNSHGTVKLCAYRSGNDIIVSGTASATLTTECSRCCTEMPVVVSADLMLVMEERDGPPDDEELELHTDELGREFYSGTEIELDEIIRDHLLLEVPMQPRCVDPPCPDWVKKYLTIPDDDADIPEEPDGTADPRMAPLAALKDKLKGDKN